MTGIYVLVSTIFLIVLTSARSPDYVHDGRISRQYQDHKFDTMPVMPKRAALFLDRLMVALHEAMENHISGEKGGRGSYSSKESTLPLEAKSSNYIINAKSKGNPKRLGSKNFWRCYFNAVTCF